MKKIRFLILSTFLAVTSLGVSAQTSTSTSTPAPVSTPNKHTLQDIERHRAMSQVHEAAAKCLASGKNHDFCQKELQLSCKGLGIGKFCGMKHTD
jgi:hypothetical protein